MLNYTYLHAFTRFYTRVLAVTLTGVKPTEVGSHESEGQSADNAVGETPTMATGRVAAPPGGRRWEEGGLDVGKGGRELGKRTGFAHLAPGLTRLGPDNST